MGTEEIQLVTDSWLGGPDLFVVRRGSRDPSVAARPLLLPLRRDDREPRLSARLDTPTHLVVERRGSATTIDLVDVEQDSDRDGWTDLEEARLGTRADLTDSDGDGIADGRDCCPLLGRDAESVSGEEAEILRRALFAVFGLGHARHLLLVEAPSPRLHVAGYGGPILFDVDRAAWTDRHGCCGVFVRWRLVARTENEAAVEIEDYSGMLAAGGQRVYLRRMASRWVVVGRSMTWVS